MIRIYTKQNICIALAFHQELYILIVEQNNHKYISKSGFLVMNNQLSFVLLNNGVL